VALFGVLWASIDRLLWGLILGGGVSSFGIEPLLLEAGVKDRRGSGGRRLVVAL
jgi:hypothetical protein